MENCERPQRTNSSLVQRNFLKLTTILGETLYRIHRADALFDEVGNLNNPRSLLDHKHRTTPLLPKPPAVLIQADQCVEDYINSKLKNGCHCTQCGSISSWRSWYSSERTEQLET